VEVCVTSQNATKIQASKSAVRSWLDELFTNEKEWKMLEKGYEVSSGIDEQPHGLDITIKGSMNRLMNMKVELGKNGIDDRKQMAYCAY
jgi:non-canonical (house-cleaning) NTP pyrophosphatase